MRSQFLKIDFIDESVALNAEHEVSDYIGSARIPLRDIAEVPVSQTVPIINQKNMTMG